MILSFQKRALLLRARDIIVPETRTLLRAREVHTSRARNKSAHETLTPRILFMPQGSTPNRMSNAPAIALGPGACDRCGAYVGTAQKKSKWCPHCSMPEGQGVYCFWKRCVMCGSEQWTPDQEQTVCGTCAAVADTWHPMSGTPLCPAGSLPAHLRAPSLKTMTSEPGDGVDEEHRIPLCYNFKCLGCLTYKLCLDAARTHCDECYFSIRGEELVSELVGLANLSTATDSR